MPEFHYQVGTVQQSIRVAKVSEQTYQLQLNDQAYLISDPHWQAGYLTFQFEGQQIRCAVVQADQQLWVGLAGEVFRLTKTDPHRTRRQVQAGDSLQVRATMPGTVQAILVEVGTPVQQGQPVLILEAMKMELRLTAPQTGLVDQILVQPGQLVEQGTEVIILA
jgi:biotin carboxyl carrier protein